MQRTILIYGAISGAVVIGAIGAGLALAGGEPGAASSSMLVGYLIMIVAFSTIFIAIKRHRDREPGGSIGFVAAVGMGLGISAVAGVVYVAVWEIYLSLTDYAFIGQYADAMIAAAKAAGTTGAELDRVVAEMDQMKTQYADPLVRLPMTFLEIFPVGVVIALVSAALLRNPKFMPARV